MKYKIVIERSEKGFYTAYSPVAEILHANGESIGEVLENLRAKMLCHLHDPQIELDIIVEFEDRFKPGFSNGLMRHAK